MRAGLVAGMLGLLAGGAVGCQRAALPAPPEWTLHVDPLPSPAGPASAQPQLTVSRHGVLLSWLENADVTTTFKFAERSAGGWTEPRTIHSGSDFWVNFADVPSALRLEDRTLIAHWLQSRTDDDYAYEIRLTRSRDDGATWEAPFAPHHDDTKSEHGFASLFDLHGGAFGLVWLDGRNLKPSPSGEGVGDMTLRAATFTADARQTSEEAIDLRVCECCPTTAAATADGVVVAYRDRRADEVRNIQVTRFAGGKWTEPAPLHDDGWRIDGCPVNGPAASAVDRNVAIAWFTVQEDQGHAFVAFSTDAGRTFAAPIRVDEAGSLGRVDVEQLEDGSAVVAWMEQADRKVSFAARRVEPSGGRSAPVVITEMRANRNSGYPRMARHGRELVFAWPGTDDSLGVQTAVARVP
jgi:hypothetical protein